jgi:hypothetical protein
MRKIKQKRIKRKPDLRKIRISHVYTLPEIAKCLDRELSTIQRWVKTGLPIIEGSKPPLVDGVELKTWLVLKWQSKKKPCRDGELLCCSCSKPQKPIKGSVSLQPRTDKTITILGRCGQCRKPQKQVGSLSKLEEIKVSFCLPAQAVQHLLGCNDTSVSDNIIPFSKTKAKIEEKEPQLSMLDLLQKNDKQQRT